MTMITINLDDAVLATHLALIGDGTFEQHLNAYLANVGNSGSHADEIEPQDVAAVPGGQIYWLKAVEIAVARMADMPVEQRFTIQDLFTAEEWSRVQSPKWVGRRFGSDVEKAGIAKRVSTTPTNKAIYQRTA